MEKIRARLAVSFSAKVLGPVLAVMVLLMAITVWLVNHRLAQQFQADAARSLATADGEFQNAQKSRTKALVQRFRNLRREPRYKAVFGSGDQPTIINAIKDLPDEQGVDAALFTTPDGEMRARVKRDPLLAIGEFETNSAAAISRALRGDDTADTIRVGEQLFDVVSTPVVDGGGNLLGVLTLGSEIRNADVQEFSQLTRSQIVLLANGRVIASTLANPEPKEDFGKLFTDCLAGSDRRQTSAPLKKLLLGDEHYFCSAGQFTTLGGDGKLGYLLLSSYEQPLRALQSTQQMLLLVSSLAILLGTAIVWFLVRKVTAPLRALSPSARGTFPKRSKSPPATNVASWPPSSTR